MPGRPRPGVAFGLLLLGLLGLMWLAWPARGDPAPGRALARWLALSDLCLDRASPAARHPSLSDPALPLQLVPAGLDPFPAPPILPPQTAWPRGSRIEPARRARP